jgi:hypothetical protein
MKERDFNEFGGWFDPELPGGGHPTKAIDLASFLLETRPVPEFDARVLAAPWLESLLTDGPTAPVLRKLLAARLVAIVSSGHPPHEIYERMHKLRLPECAPLLAKAATDPKVDLHLRAQLIAAVGCLGTEREVAVLVPLVADTKHVTNVHEGGGKVRSTHLGDVALAACLKLSGRDFAEFGMPHVKQALSVLDVHHVGFVTEADRAEALRRWSSATGK